jgi:hypothetical protein
MALLISECRMRSENNLKDEFLVFLLNTPQSELRT